MEGGEETGTAVGGARKSRPSPLASADGWLEGVVTSHRPLLGLRPLLRSGETRAPEARGQSEGKGSRMAR